MCNDKKKQAKDIHQNFQKPVFSLTSRAHNRQLTYIHANVSGLFGF